MRGKRKQEGFNLAFLDIMSCGLGAVVLVFMLIKHQTDELPEPGTASDFLSDKVQQLRSEKKTLEDNLRRLLAEADADAQQAALIRDKIARLEQSLADKDSNIGDAERELEKLKQELRQIKVDQPEDIVSLDRISEEDYLLGLKVEGRKIAFLVDASASMTAEKLIDVIKVKNASDQEKMAAHKWLRTRNVVRWLLARLPAHSEISVIAYNGATHELGGSGWLPAKSQPDVEAILADLDKLVPEGPTNLHKGLIEIKKLQPTNLYIVTDGLPTTGEARYKSLNPFADCSSLRGRSNTISGACRIKLFQQTIADTALSGVVVNVVLLPIEGDPDALNQYWYWASKSDGLVISPASNWP